MNKNLRRRLPCILVTGLLFIALLMFMGILISTKIVPAKFLLIIGGLFLLVTLCVFLLTWNTRRLKSFLFGCIIMILVLIILVVGTNYLSRAVATLDRITAVDVETTELGVYVRQEDSATQLSDLVGYRFGILEQLDRETTNKAISMLEDELGTDLDIIAYPGLAEMADGILTEKTVDVLVFNTAYFDILREVAGYEDIDSQLRLIHTQTIETKIESTKNTENNGWGILGAFNSSQEEVENNTFAMYISGIDSRSGLISKSRSDVNILAVINPDTRQILLVNTPRDFYVPLPISGGVPDKLTHAGIYGVDVSVGTLEMLYGIDIDYYFRVNFSGFEQIVDALDGITVYSDVAFTALKKHYISEGENYLNGEAALAFARERYAFAEGDRVRGENQMKVIKAVIEKAMSPTLLTNYASIMDSVSGSFETSMPYDKIAELVRNQLDNGGSWNIVNTSVNGTGDYKVPYSMSTEAYVMVPDQATVDAAKAKIQQVYNGEFVQ